MNFDFLTAIKNIAPTLAATFGTPLMGLAVQAICATIPTGAAREVTDAHNNDPVNGALAKLSDLFQQGQITTQHIKEAENAHAEKMAELGYKNVQALEALAVDDRKDARLMQRETKSNVPGALAVFVTAGFFLILVLLMNGTFKATDNQALLILLGALATSFGAIINYYYGSSAGSKAKDDTLAAIAKS